MDALRASAIDDLNDRVEAVYSVFRHYTLSADFEVCQCPVCMDAAIRSEIIATPPRNLSPRLVAEYSNSAHGVPKNTDHLKALLPRYLDLIAQGVAADQLEIGCELRRFGDARRDGTLQFSAAEDAAVTAWVQAFVAAIALDAVDGEDRTALPYCLAMLMCGGWSVTQVAGAFEAAFDAPETGLATRARFAKEMIAALAWKEGDLWAVATTDAASRTVFADWLKSMGMSARMDEVILSDLPEDDCEAALAYWYSVKDLTGDDFRTRDSPS